MSRKIRPQEEVVSFCQKLIRTPSETGKEKQVAEAMLEEMGELGYDEARVDGFGNVIGVIKGKKQGRILLFDGHMDTIGVSDEKEWKHAPFGGVIEGNRVYGRGAADMKGALAAMVVGLAGVDKENIAGEIRVTGTVCEERFEGTALKNVIEGMREKPAGVVIGEASGLDLKIGQRGRCELRVSIEGKEAHSAHPEKGENALERMADVIKAIQRLEANRHDKLGEGILVPVFAQAPRDVAEKNFQSVVPGSAEVFYDERTLPGETPESVVEHVEKAFKHLKARVKVEVVTGRGVTYTGKEFEALRFFPAWIMGEDSELVRKALSGLRKTGLKPGIKTYSFCTNGSYSAGEAGIPTIGFGPMDEGHAHTRDEFAGINDLRKAMHGYKAIAEEFLRS